MEWLGEGHDPRTETLSSLTSSPISLYLTLLQYAFFFFIELHLLSFSFAASVYFLIESRGNVRLHSFWPH